MSHNDINTGEASSATSSNSISESNADVNRWYTTKTGGVFPTTALIVSTWAHKTILSGTGGILNYYSLLNNDNAQKISVFDSHSIHGIKEWKDKVMVFGEKGMCILAWNEHKNHLQLKIRFSRMADMIVDACLVGMNENIVAVGYAHNFVELYYLGLGNHITCIGSIQCPVICVLFSMSIIIDREDEDRTILKIASGTAFGKLVLWDVVVDKTALIGDNPSSAIWVPERNFDRVIARGTSQSPSIEKSCIVMTNMRTIVAHEGVIFRTVWSKSKCYLATVSDDRTVRVWDIERGVQVFVGWGHIARLWDVVFLYESSWVSASTGLTSESMQWLPWLATSSEDGTVRVWDAMQQLVVANSMKTNLSSPNEDEACCVGVLRCQPSNIWRIAAVVDGSYDTVLVSGSDDGGIRCWHLDAHLIASPIHVSVGLQTMRIPQWIEPTQNISVVAEIMLSVESSAGAASVTTEMALGCSEEVSMQADIITPGDVCASSDSEIEEPALNVQGDEAKAIVDGSACGVDIHSMDRKEPVDATKKKKKKKKSKKVNPNANQSRRENGVCAVFVSPSADFILVILIDGSVWLVSIKSGRDNAPNYGWYSIFKSDRVVTAATIDFLDQEKTNFVCVLAHPSGFVSMFRASQPVSCHTANEALEVGCGLVIESTPCWCAHENRLVIMMCLVDIPRHSSNGSSSSLLSEKLLVTSAAAGICRVWRISQIFSALQSGEFTSIPTRVYGLECRTGGKGNVGTSAVFVPCKNGISNSDGFLVIGDSRGGITIFDISIELAFALVSAEETSHIGIQNSVQFIASAHATDPVSSLALAPNAVALTVSESAGRLAFYSVGHDGYLNSYRFHAQFGIFNDVGCAMTDCFSIVNKLSCLPIKTPTMLAVKLEEESEHSVNPGSRSCELSTSILVGGFLGAMFIIWDIKSQMELMRVEGGGWKRPHDCAIVRPVAVGEPRSSLGFMHIVFACPIPLKYSTLLAVSDNRNGWHRAMVTCGAYRGSAAYLSSTLLSASNGVDAIYKRYLSMDNSEQLKLRTRLRTSHALSKTGYSVGFVSVGNDKDNLKDFIAVGGEDGVVNIMHSSSLKIVQEVHMPAFVASKCISVSYRRSDLSDTGNESGIIVSAGGKLSYSVWKISRFFEYDNLLSLGAAGSIWVRATQDHRIMSVSSVYLNAGELLGSAYLISFGDSRGMLTIAGYGLTHQAHQSNAHPQRLQILDEFQISESPITSCDMVVLKKVVVVSELSEIQPILLACGDTMGNIFVVFAAIAVSSNPENGIAIQMKLRDVPQCIARYNGHTMGANTVSLYVKQQTSVSQDDEIVNQFVVASGGDDQSIALCEGDFILSSTEQQIPTSFSSTITGSGPPNWKAVVEASSTRVERVVGSLGSAFKGVKLIALGRYGKSCIDAEDHSSGMDSLALVGIGYDQRLIVLRLLPRIPFSVATRVSTSDDADESDAETTEVLDQTRFAGCKFLPVALSRLFPLRSSPERRQSIYEVCEYTTRFAWLTGAMIQVGDVAGLDAEVLHEDNARSAVDGDGPLTHVVVVGHGLQVLDLRCGK